MAIGYLSEANDKVNGLSYDALLYCKTNVGGYFFDGFLQVDHSRELEITENPVETGAAIVDHSYVKPAEITMEILMSDVHQSLVPGQFSGGWSRSVTAWSVLKQLQDNRVPVSVLTRLDLYENMLIQSLSASDTSDTYTGLRATVVLRELPVARVKKVKISLADQTTINTQMGKLEAETVDRELISTLYALFGSSSTTENRVGGGGGRP